MPRNYRYVIHLAINFLLANLSFNACANISRKYLTDQGFGSLGNYSLGITYALLAIASPVASFYSQKYDCRKVVNIGSFSYFFCYFNIELVGLLILLWHKKLFQPKSSGLFFIVSIKKKGLISI